MVLVKKSCKCESIKPIRGRSVWHLTTASRPRPGCRRRLRRRLVQARPGLDPDLGRPAAVVAALVVVSETFASSELGFRRRHSFVRRTSASNGTSLGPPYSTLRACLIYIYIYRFSSYDANSSTGGICSKWCSSFLTKSLNPEMWDKYHVIITPNSGGRFALSEPYGTSWVTEGDTVLPIFTIYWLVLKIISLAYSAVNLQWNHH